MSGFFVTAIGTDVGKTFVTAALTYQLRQAGQAVKAYKPVISGYSENTISDTTILLEAAGLPATPAHIHAISPWRFAAPISPHLAAMEEHREIHPTALIDWSKQALTQEGIVVIEGVGGIMVPLRHQFLVLDWMHAIGLPVILVTGTYLGAINHSLLSLVVLRQAGLKLAGVVVSQSAQQDAGLAQTCDAICTGIGDAVPVVPVERIQDTENAWKMAPELLSLIV